MSDGKPVFNLSDHIVRVMMGEPFFPSLSRRIDKIDTTSNPTAGVRIKPEHTKFKIIYNPSFMAAPPPDNHMRVVFNYS